MSDDDAERITGLVASAAAGDQRAWDEIVDRFTPLLISVVLRFRLSGGEREDVAQTVWLRLVENLGGLREPKALPMWIITTTRREALRCLARQARTVPLDPQGSGWADTLDQVGSLGPVGAGDLQEGVEAGLERAERRQALMEGLSELSPRQRELLILMLDDPPPAYAEISRRTGIPVGAIGPTRARALARLRRTRPMQALQSSTGAGGGSR
jgi:RNA polymerase sigma factor (sigma-70 family)